MDAMVLGTTMDTEFQNPPRMPSHCRPVHTVNHACAQGSSVSFTGSEKRLPRRISSIGLIDVITITYIGTRKGAAAVNRKAYRPRRPGGPAARARAGAPRGSA